MDLFNENFTLLVFFEILSLIIEQTIGVTSNAY